MNKEKKIDLMLENQIKMMNFLSFGYPQLKVDEIFRNSLLNQVGKTREALSKKLEKKPYEKSIAGDKAKKALRNLRGNLKC